MKRGVAEALEMKVEMINRMAHLTPVRTYRLAQASGVDYDAANVVVTYPQRFELRDRRADLDFLVRAKEVTAKIGSSTLQREIDRQLARVVLERDDVLEVVEGELGDSVSSGGGG